MGDGDIMKVLDPLLVQTLGKGDHREIVCIIAKGFQLQFLGKDEVYSNLLYIDFSENSLLLLDTFKTMFPTSWWINLRRNALQHLTHDDLPGVIGSLDLSRNLFYIETVLKNLVSKHILRLNLVDNEGFDSTQQTVRKTVITVLTDVWVLDEDFISSTERKQARDLVSVRTWTAPNRKFYMNGEWETTSTLHTNERVAIMLSALQKFPDDEMKIDIIKLEILIEDYFEEARIYNKYCMHQNSVKGKEKRPSAKPIVNITQLLHLPHRVRLDLVTVLTCSLLYDIPAILIDDALSLLLLGHCSPEISNRITKLPNFVKTGLVCVMRRISARERLEYQQNGNYCIKPREKVDLSDSDGLMAPTFQGVNGFNHLRSFKDYMALDIDHPNKLKYDESVTHEAFSELEHEILEFLHPGAALSTFGQLWALLAQL